MNVNQLSPDQLLRTSTGEACKNCGGLFYREVLMLRRISRVMIGANKDQLVPVPIMRCDDCGQPIEDMIPHFPEDHAEVIEPEAQPANESKIIQFPQ